MSKVPALLGANPTFGEKIPLTKPVLPTFESLAEGLEPIIESGILTKGDQVKRLEAMIARHLNVRHAIAVSNCTAGLMLVYRALNLSGEVIVPSFTFMATISALVWTGARPVFVDVDPDTQTIDPSAVEAAITPNTSAIIAVHNFGNPADIDALQEIADRNDLRLIFDAAHGFGTQYAGSPVGAKGNAHVFSMSATKLVAAGEGGVVATNDQMLADTVRIGREYGNCGNYDSVFVGLNARLSEIHSLLAIRSLQELETNTRRRNDIADRYRQSLSALPGIGFQLVREGNRSSYHMMAIKVDADSFGLTRDELREVLTAENIDTRCYYDPPVHRQSAYKQYANRGDYLFHTNQLAATAICLPVFSNLDSDALHGICNAIALAHEFAPEIKAKIGGLALV